VRESRDRVRSAIRHSGLDYPDGNVVINLAPGGLSKTSAALDLPIAVSILAATRQISLAHLSQFEFLGELGLFGELRQINGALACALAARDAGRRLIIPWANAAEARVAPSGVLGLARTLQDVVQAMNASRVELIDPHGRPETEPVIAASDAGIDQVIGQQAAKRALTIAAAGGHHVLMVGPPGTGKTMLARGFCQLLPPLTAEASLQVAAIYSAAGLTRPDYAAVPFRDPHHSASAPALVGGGNPPMPGEIALAHHGVLFLDELPHFKPSALNLLREPIESGKAVIARAKHKVSFPCRFQLIAAMNPCPAGRACKEDACRCTPAQVQRYQARISGPLLDRIDIQVSVPALSQELLTRLERHSPPSSLANLRKQVAAARSIQLRRQDGLNAAMRGELLRDEMARARLDRGFLENAISRYNLSARSYHKLWRIARTIADVELAERIDLNHMTEAMSYRALDWEGGVG